MAAKYALGLDYGTNSVRALIVNVATGEEIGTHVFAYPHGDAGILLDAKDPNLARQHPHGLPGGRGGFGARGLVPSRGASGLLRG